MEDLFALLIMLGVFATVLLLAKLLREVVKE